MNLSQANAQIRLQIKYEPNWILLDDTINMTLARSKSEWINLNRKNFPAVIREANKYNYNWYSLSSGEFNIPKGYKKATLQDVSDFGNNLFEENADRIKNSPIWVYNYETSNNELAPQIIVSNFSKASNVTWKAKSGKAQIAFIEDEVHFYNNVLKDTKFEDLADETAEASVVLKDNLKSYFETNLKSFIRDGENYFISYKGEIRFNEGPNNFLKNIQLQSSFSQSDEFINKINSDLDDWAMNNFPVQFDLRLNKEFPISSYHPIAIEVFNASAKKVIKQKNLWPLKFNNYPIANVEKINIPSGFKNAVQYGYIENVFKVNVQNETILDSKYAILQEFRLNKAYRFKPLLSLIGCANTKDKTLYKWFYSTIAITGVAHLAQNAFYNRYLKNPNERQGAYSFANNFYKLKLLGGLTIGTMILFDAGIAVRKFNKTKRLVQSLNNELQNMVWQ
jgi:hypothetical protein